MTSQAVQPSRDAHDRARLGAVLLITGVVVFSTAWLIAGGWRFDSSRPWWLVLAVGLMLPALVVFGLFGLSIFAFVRRRPARFGIGGGPVGNRFVASPNYGWLAAQGAGQLALGAFIAGGVLRSLENDNSPFGYAYAAAMFALIGLTAVLSLVFVVALLGGANRVQLHPWGLRVVYVHGGQDIPWEAVSAGPSPGPQSWRTAWVGIGRSDLVRSSGLAKRHPRRVWLPLVAVPIGFLVDAVNHYLRHPEDRATIGTVEGHEHLVRALLSSDRPLG
jgi:hypothetical protein